MNDLLKVRYLFSLLDTTSSPRARPRPPLFWKKGEKFSQTQLTRRNKLNGERGEARKLKGEKKVHLITVGFLKTERLGELWECAESKKVGVIP